MATAGCEVARGTFWGKLDEADAPHAVAGFAALPPQLSNVGTLEGLTGE